MAFNTIADEEVAQDGPMSYTTGRKFRDNVLAIAGADDTGETAPRIEPGALRNPINSDSVTVAAVSRNMVSVTGETNYIDAVIVVPGVYRFVGTISTNGSGGDLRIKKNGTTQDTESSGGAFDNAYTLVNGDHMTVTLESDSGATNYITVSDFEIKADYAAPINFSAYLQE